MQAQGTWTLALLLTFTIVPRDSWAQQTRARALYWPTNRWTESSPEAQGISSSDLADALEFARVKTINIHSLTIVRNGTIVLDAYFYPFTPDVRHDVASATKSVTSMLVGLAIADGHLEGLRQPILAVLPSTSTRGAGEGAAAIRIQDLLTMQSGLDCGFATGERELRDMRRASDWVAYAVRLKTVGPPGTRFGYCSPNFHLLSAAIAATTARSPLEYARRRLFDPLGIKDVEWPADAKGVNHGWGDLQLRPRDMAKLGLLMLERGQWAARQILPTAWVDDSVLARADANPNERYGLGWWLSKQVPTLFEANGRGGQRISIVPDKRLVVVMTGGGFEPGEIGAFLLRAVRSDAALPEDRAARTRLESELQRIAAPPPRVEPRASSNARRFSGRVYKLDENALGLRSFQVQFNGASAELRLRSESGENIRQPLGLDGRYRLTAIDRGALSAGRAEWLANGRFRIELNRLSRINRYVLDVDFRDGEIDIAAFEPTELGRASLHGTRQPGPVSR